MRISVAIPLLLAVLALAIAAAPGEVAARGFDGKVDRLSDRAKTRMKANSWRPGCPVPLGKLRMVHLTHRGFDGRNHRGRIVVHRDHAGRTLRLFKRLHAKRFPIRRVKPIDAYGGDDNASMDADNTSGFNCRVVAGTSRWSNHAYGKAIDLNPRENPYVTPSGHVSPAAGAKYVDRSDRRKGMILARGPVVRSFRRILGWKWGGNWTGTRDYQHFSFDGR